MLFVRLLIAALATAAMVFVGVTYATAMTSGYPPAQDSLMAFGMVLAMYGFGMAYLLNPTFRREMDPPDRPADGG
jgi:hypothetical protein